MRDEALKKIINLICDCYLDTLLTGIEEYKKDFPYTIACANFIGELKAKNIMVNFFNIFEDNIVDMVFREISNYLAR